MPVKTLIVLGLLLGCHAPDAPATTVSAAADARPADAPIIPAPIAAAPATPPPPAPVKRPAAYLLSGGVFRLDGASAAVALDPGRAAPVLVTLDRDERPWVLDAHRRVTIYDGTRPRLADLRDTIFLAPAVRGGVWAIAAVGPLNRRLFWIDAAGTSHPIDSPTDGGHPIDLHAAAVLDAGDAVWIACDVGILRYTVSTRTWETMRRGSVMYLVRDTSGVVWTVDDNDLMHPQLIGFDGATQLALDMPADRIQPPMALVPTPDGRVIAFFDRTGTKGWLASFRRRGSAAVWDRAMIGSRQELDALLAVDGAGRIWIGEHGGLAVLDADGRTLVEYPGGTLPGVIGYGIQAVEIAGNGPTAFPPRAPVPTGSLRGRLIDAHGAPIKVRLEICIYDCNGGAPRFTLATDGDGNFAVDHVRIASYATARRTGTDASDNLETALVPSGRRGHDFDCCLQLKPGGTLDLGTLVLSPLLTP